MGSDGVNPRGALIAGLCIIGLAVGLILLSLSFIVMIHNTYTSAAEAQQFVLIEHTGYTVFYMAPLVFLALLIIGAACVAVGLRGRAFSRAASEQLNKIVAPMVIAGLAGMFAGSYLGNRMWADWFQGQGYVACSGSFTITSKWFTGVWVTDPEYCHNEVVRDMFRSGQNLETINQYLEQQERRGRRALEPTGRDSV